MIIDGQAEFRTLLLHHVTTHWPDALITVFDPLESGHLPDEFSGAGNDAVLLGDQQGDRDGLKVLQRFCRRNGFPPVLYFSSSKDREAAKKFGARAWFRRDDLSHDALVVRLADVLVERRDAESPDKLFGGDQDAGVTPLIRGYRFIKKLSTTEHSAVFLAERESAGVKVVLKVLRHIPDATDSGGAFDRFLQEYELIAELDHPNVVRIHDLGVGDDHAHIAMEYLPGGDLRQRIARGIPEADAVSYLQQIARAMAQIHRLGIVHRDLKPGNIMFRDDGTLALIDFGLAKRMRLEMEITDSGEIFGTPYYMSPEQGHGNASDLRSDLYSLGVIFYEMLTGDKPFSADTAMGIIYRHANSPIPLLPQRLGHHQALINMLLAKNPDDRLESADEVLEWL